jgi:membrane protease YdiL (CAAX protease family)
VTLALESAPPDVVVPWTAGRRLRRRLAIAGSVVLVGALAVINIARDQLPAGTLWLSLAAAPALLGFARMTGLSWADLGLGRARLVHGAGWGAGAIGVIGAAYLVGVLLPPTRQLFLDARYHLPPAEALMTALVVIPIGTVLLEEVAFRSVLWGFLHRHMTASKVLLVSSGLFGVWHVLPALSSAGRGAADHGPWTTALLVAGTVAFTALGGVVAGELRRRSGSLLASAGMHWATNSLGVLFGLAAWRLAAR